MTPDPILREVHRMKDQLARRVSNDVGTLFDQMREASKQHPERMVKPTAKPVKRGRRRPTRQ